MANTQLVPTVPATDIVNAASRFDFLHFTDETISEESIPEKNFPELNAKELGQQMHALNTTIVSMKRADSEMYEVLQDIADMIASVLAMSGLNADIKLPMGYRIQIDEKAIEENEFPVQLFKTVGNATIQINGKDFIDWDTMHEFASDLGNGLLTAIHEFIKPRITKDKEVTAKYTNVRDNLKTMMQWKGRPENKQAQAVFNKKLITATK